MSAIAERLHAIYQALADHYGPQGWWPGDTPFEVMVGAVLVQNTNWSNVEKAIAKLKGAGLLSFAAFQDLPQPLLAEYIRPAGYYNQKSERLLRLFSSIAEHYGELDAFLALPARELREELLAQKGIGPETADAICLYAAKRPFFVADSYSFRILVRHGFLDPDEGFFYEDAQSLFMDNLPEDVELFGEFHALIVQVGKDFCKKSKPLCDSCPLMGL